MLSLRFNRTTEYALRAMAHLALQPRNRPVPVMDLSQRTGIPQHYLSKVMKKLVEAGLVISRKGHGGGFVLSKRPGAIPYHDILRASGYEAGENRCVFGWGDCDAQSPCPLHFSWVDLNDKFKQWVRDTTLQDVRPPAGDGSSSRPPESPD